MLDSEACKLVRALSGDREHTDTAVGMPLDFVIPCYAISYLFWRNSGLPTIAGC
ncbi:DEKNAAC102117 [Brettanomyces naardenensis]|uniref:DEKNAAC102117 n=1 Tax=Brettanomyces naardenensis TaxID=13370 RepID=A0A448YJM9_BRENA|nr:DEKNAAC102117 [Brettanomyces naardenensis]